MKRLSLRDAIIATVAYADIFGYPLTLEELAMWFPLKRSHLAQQGETLKRLKRSRVAGVDYYGLHSVSQLVSVRHKREIWSKKKMEFAKRIGWWFRFVPTISLVGVTGGLAMANAKKQDDIDLFFVTKKGTLWVSRLVTTLIAELLGVRRRPKDTKVMNKVCLNMFMAEDAAALPPKERDLFAAHEVLQMVPLWERDGTYQKFLAANSWVKKFLPNAWKEKYEMINVQCTMRGIRVFLDIVHFTLRIIEPIARFVQLWYMRNRRTNEVISGSIIRFHPTDARVWVRDALGARLARYNIPLDKVFCGS